MNFQEHLQDYCDEMTTIKNAFDSAVSLEKFFAADSLKLDGFKEELFKLVLKNCESLQKATKFFQNQEVC